MSFEATTVCSCHAPGKSVNRPFTLAQRTNAIVHRDPTRTISLRNRFVAELNRRFRKLAEAIRVSVEDNDCFGLAEKKQISILTSIPPRAFQFKTSPQKVHGFMDWLEGEVDKDLLTVTRGPRRVVAGAKRWSDTYIESSYQKGMMDSYGKLVKAGGKKATEKLGTTNATDFVKVGFGMPFHADRVGLLYIRAFDELKGITASMERTISSSLAESLAEGRSPYQVARILMSRIEDTGEDLGFEDTMGRQVPALQRARVLARTEIIRAHAEANLNTFEEAGIEGVAVEAEWVTAGDDRVCPRCAPMEGKQYSIQDAHGRIPLHPQCRCTWVPVV